MRREVVYASSLLFRSAPLPESASLRRALAHTVGERASSEEVSTR